MSSIDPVSTASPPLFQELTLWGQETLGLLSTFGAGSSSTSQSGGHGCPAILKGLVGAPSKGYQHRIIERYWKIGKALSCVMWVQRPKLLSFEKGDLCSAILFFFVCFFCLLRLPLSLIDLEAEVLVIFQFCLIQLLGEGIHGSRGSAAFSCFFSIPSSSVCS